jgi:hypothetical protein
MIFFQFQKLEIQPPQPDDPILSSGEKVLSLWATFNRGTPTHTAHLQYVF